MDGKDEKNFEQKPIEDLTAGFLPVWMDDISDEDADTTETSSDVAGPTLTGSAGPSKLNDINDEESDEEEPPSKKLKGDAFPIGVCSYKLCHSILLHICFECQRFYCQAHTPANAHECKSVYSSSLSESSDEDVNTEHA